MLVKEIYILRRRFAFRKTNLVKKVVYILLDIIEIFINCMIFATP
jgi:hypothetical protein